MVDVNEFFFLFFLLHPRQLCELADIDSSEVNMRRRVSKGFNLLFFCAASCRAVQLFISFIAIINAMMSHHLITVNYCKNSVISRRQLLPFTTQSRKRRRTQQTPPPRYNSQTAGGSLLRGAPGNINSPVDGAVLHHHSKPPNPQTEPRAELLQQTLSRCKYTYPSCF